LGTVIAVVFVAVLLGAPYMRRLMRESRTEAPFLENDSSFVMRPNRTARWTLWFCAAIALAGIIGLFRMLWPRWDAALVLGLGVFLPFAIGLLSPRRRIYVSIGGIRIHQPGAGQRFIAWADVKEVKSYRRGQTLRLFGNGRWHVIHATMTGMPLLEAAITANLSKSLCSEALKGYHAFIATL